MKFTNEELNLICTALSAWNAKRIKFDSEEGIPVDADEYIKISNKIAKKVFDELTNRIREEK